MLSNKQLMFSIIAVLVLLRFVFVPWSDMHDSRLEALSVVTKQLQRSLGIEKTIEPMALKLEQLVAEQQRLRMSLQSASSEDELRLNLQKNWAAKAATAGIEIEMFDWRSQLSLSEPDIFQGKIALSLSGSIVSVAEFITEIEKQTGVNVISMRLTTARSRSSVPAVNANLELQLIYALDA